VVNPVLVCLGGRRKRLKRATNQWRDKIRDKERIQRIPRSMHWAVEDIELPEDDGREIAGKIIRDKGKCVCDGSLKNEMGTAAGTFMGVDETFVVRNRTPGASSDQSSFRSELCGILALILVVNAIATHHGIEQGTVTLACDNESALWAEFGIAEAGTGESSFDIIRVIHHAIRMSPVTWHHRHVQGHQDDDKDRILDQWERANVEVDRLCRYGAKTNTAGDARGRVATRIGWSTHSDESRRSNLRAHTL